MRQIIDSAVDLLEPPPSISVADWVVQNVRLNRHVEASSGPYNIVDNPFMTDILNALMDREVREITVKKSTQVGGTLGLIAMLSAVSELDPSPSMVLTPDLTSAIELRDRIYFDMLESPTLANKVPRETEWNNRHIDLESCRAYIAWAGSAQRTRGRPCKRVFRTETDVYPAKATRGGDPMAASSQRVKRFYWNQLFNESSPHSEQSIIAGRWEQSNQQHWWCKCPVCGCRQVLRFFLRHGETCGGVVGYKDDKGELLPIDEATRSARYKCLQGCEWDNQQKDQAVKAGRWLPSGMYYDADGNVQGEPRRDRRHLGFHLWSMHSPIISIAKVVGAYYDVRESGNMGSFFQDWLGLKYVSTQKVPHWVALGRHLQTDYQRNSVVPAVHFLTAGCDVQQDGVWYVIRGWGNLKTSYLIDFGYLRRYQTDSDDPVVSISGDLTQIKQAVLDRKFPVAGGLSPQGKTHMGVLMAGVDANFRTRDVHDWLHSLGLPESKLRAVRGDHQMDPRQKFRRTVVEKTTRTGQEYAGGLPLYGIYVSSYKDDMLERWKIGPGKTGCFHLPQKIISWGSEYLRQITNEGPSEEKDRNGRLRRRWKTLNENVGNHLHDCEVYAAACADMVIAEAHLTWDSRTWPAVGTSRVVDYDQGPDVVVRDYLEGYYG